MQQPQPQFNQDKGQSFGSSMESKMEKFMDVMSSKMSQQNEAQKRMVQMIRNHSSSIDNLEVQMGQLANFLSIRNQGTLPSNMENNPKEQVKAIT